MRNWAIGFWPNYDVRARAVPTCIASVLPILLGGLACYGTDTLEVPSGLLAVLALATFVLAALTAQLGRDRGKKKEPDLFDDWGGKPTTAMLRHRDSRITDITKNRIHHKLDKLVGNVSLPSPDEESQNPRGADKAYDSCVAFLREATRDKEQYELVFSENVNYGFRRNLWAMKPMGVTLTVFALGGGLWCASRDLDTALAQPFTAGSLLLLAFLFSVWSTVISPLWVKVAADAYAERLLASCETL